MNTIERFYAELGFKTQKNLNKVRGQKLAKLTADEFAALPDFQRAMAGRKATKEDIEAFKLGFTRAIEENTVVRAPEKLAGSYA